MLIQPSSGTGQPWSGRPNQLRRSLARLKEQGFHLQECGPLRLRWRDTVAESIDEQSPRRLRLKGEHGSVSLKTLMQEGEGSLAERHALYQDLSQMCDGDRETRRSFASLLKAGYAEPQKRKLMDQLVGPLLERRADDPYREGTEADQQFQKGFRQRTIELLAKSDIATLAACRQVFEVLPERESALDFWQQTLDSGELEPQAFRMARRLESEPEKIEGRFQQLAASGLSREPALGRLLNRMGQWRKDYHFSDWGQGQSELGHIWSDSPGRYHGDRDDSLRRRVSLKEIEGSTLSLQARHEFATDDFCRLEVSSDGRHWDELYTFKENQPWTGQRIDLSAYDGQEIELRFHMITDRYANFDGIQLAQMQLRGRSQGKPVCLDLQHQAESVEPLLGSLCEPGVPLEKRQQRLQLIEQSAAELEHPGLLMQLQSGLSALADLEPDQAERQRKNLTLAAPSLGAERALQLVEADRGTVLNQALAAHFDAEQVGGLSPLSQPELEATLKTAQSWSPDLHPSLHRWARANQPGLMQGLATMPVGLREDLNGFLLQNDRHSELSGEIMKSFVEQLQTPESQLLHQDSEQRFSSALAAARRGDASEEVVDLDFDDGYLLVGDVSLERGAG